MAVYVHVADDAVDIRFTSRDKGAKELWWAYRDEEVLAIDTVLTKPCRVVLQHPDRHDLAWYIGERLARR